MLQNFDLFLVIMFVTVIEYKRIQLYPKKVFEIPKYFVLQETWQSIIKLSELRTCYLFINLFKNQVCRHKVKIKIRSLEFGHYTKEALSKLC